MTTFKLNWKHWVLGSIFLIGVFLLTGIMVLFGYFEFPQYFTTIKKINVPNPALVDYVYSQGKSAPAIPIPPAINKQPKQPVMPTPDLSSGDTLTLVGKWKFQIDPEDTGITKKWFDNKLDDKNWKEINVPAFWENEGITTKNQYWDKDDMNIPYSGYAWYRKHINLSATWGEKTVFLSLGKIDDLDWVYVNGELVGHTGDESGRPDVQNRLYAVAPGKFKAGKENLLAVRVCDIRGNGGMYEGPLAISNGIKPSQQRETDTRFRRRDIVQMGENVNVREQETVQGDVVSIGGSINIQGQVTGDVVSVGGNITLSSTANIGGDCVSIGGHVNKDPGAVIHGQTVNAGPTVSSLIANLIHNPRFQYNNHHSFAGSKGFNFAFFPFIIMIALVGTIIYLLLTMIVVAIVPERVRLISDTLQKEPGRALAVGILSGFVILITFILVAITIIGLPLVIIGLVVCWMSWVLGITSLAYLLGSKLSVSSKWNIQSIFGLTGIGIVIIGIIKLVPCLGWLAVILMGWASFGAVIMTRGGVKPHYPNYMPPYPYPPVPPIPPTPPPPINPIV